MSPSVRARLISQPLMHLSRVIFMRNSAPGAPGIVGHTHLSRNSSRSACMSILLAPPRFGWRRDHRAAAVDLDDRAGRWAIHQAGGAAGIGARIGIDLDPVQSL